MVSLFRTLPLFLGVLKQSPTNNHDIQTVPALRVVGQTD